MHSPSEFGFRSPARNGSAAHFSKMKRLSISFRVCREKALQEGLDSTAPGDKEAAVEIAEDGELVQQRAVGRAEGLGTLAAGRAGRGQDVEQAIIVDVHDGNANAAG